MEMKLTKRHKGDLIYAIPSYVILYYAIERQDAPIAGIPMTITYIINDGERQGCAALALAMNADTRRATTVMDNGIVIRYDIKIKR